MNKSDSIAALGKALAAFQGEIKNPNNSADNPFFKSKYAPLNDVLNLVRPVLAKHGLSIVQAPAGDGEHIIIFTTLVHSSGEWIEFQPLTLKADKATPQGAGSAITYGRRYALSAVLGISSEDDDDGNGAEQQAKPKAPAPAKKEEQITMAGPNEKPASDKQLKLLYTLVSKKNYQDGVKSYIKTNYGKDSSKDLTSHEASELIEILNGME